jgi:hypothetical protein
MYFVLKIGSTLMTGQKKKSSAQQIFSISNDQNKPKFRINTYLVLSIKHKKKQAEIGSKIIKNNIRF